MLSTKTTEFLGHLMTNDFSSGRLLYKKKRQCVQALSGPEKCDIQPSPHVTAHSHGCQSSVQLRNNHIFAISFAKPTTNLNPTIRRLNLI